MIARELKLVSYNLLWASQYQHEANKIQEILKGELVLFVEHIGSTAVPNLEAKPIIDIMVGVAGFDDLDKTIALIEELGYEYVKEFEQSFPARRFFRKGYNQDVGFHIHAVESNSDFWHRHLLFRNILRERSAIREKYSQVKHAAIAEYRDNSFEYSQSKSEFIETILQLSYSHRAPKFFSAKAKYPHYLCLYGLRENKVTGPRVAATIKKIAVEEGARQALATIIEFYYWQSAEKRHFSLGPVRELEDELVIISEFTKKTVARDFR